MFLFPLRRNLNTEACKHNRYFRHFASELQHSVNMFACKLAIVITETYFIAHFLLDCLEILQNIKCLFLSFTEKSFVTIIIQTYDYNISSTFQQYCIVIFLRGQFSNDLTASSIHCVTSIRL